MLTHSDEYRFPCTECDKKFKQCKYNQQQKQRFQIYDYYENIKMYKFLLLLFSVDSYKFEVAYEDTYKRNTIQM